MRNGPGSHPLADRDPARLSDGEWRVLIDWRMNLVEKRLDSIFKAMGVLIVSIVGGVVVFWLTAGGPH